MHAHGCQWFSHEINNRQPLQLKKPKSWELFWSYQLNSTANPAHLPQNRAKMAKSAVLFSWQLKKGSQDFDFFNCHGCRIFILCEIHCYFCPHILRVYYYSEYLYYFSIKITFDRFLSLLCMQNQNTLMRINVVNVL